MGSVRNFWNGAVRYGTVRYGLERLGSDGVERLGLVWCGVERVGTELTAQFYSPDRASSAFVWEPGLGLGAVRRGSDGTEWRGLVRYGAVWGGAARAGFDGAVFFYRTGLLVYCLEARFGAWSGTVRRGPERSGAVRGGSDGAVLLTGSGF